MLSKSYFAGVLGCGLGAPDNRSNNSSPIGVSEPSGLQARPVAGNVVTSATTEGTLSPATGFSAQPKEQFAGSNHKAMAPDDVEAQERLKN